jgi:hypothetical protein
MMLDFLKAVDSSSYKLLLFYYVGVSSSKKCLYTDNVELILPHKLLVEVFQTIKAWSIWKKWKRKSEEQFGPGYETQLLFAYEIFYSDVS